MLVVCAANICRSPLAEGLLKRHDQANGNPRLQVDSAGTHASAPGHPADPRAVKVALQHGLDIRRVRARQVQPRDFERYAFIVAVDARSFDWLQRNQPEATPARLLSLSAWTSGGVDVPDPYYGNAQGFETVYTMLDEATAGLHAELVK